MPYSDYIVYVDESGDHSLDPINPDYPIFVLDFCILRKDHYTNSVVPAVQTFKFEHFGHDIVILHEHGIRKHLPPFDFLTDRGWRYKFMDGLNRLVKEADFSIVAAAIAKENLTCPDGKPENPYGTALAFCMERTYGFLKSHGQHERTTHIVVERRGSREDYELEYTFHRICGGANQIGEMPNFEIIFADKKTNSAGLQLADLTARPIGRHILDPEQPNRAWDIIKPKLYGGEEGSVQKLGLNLFS